MISPIERASLTYEFSGSVRIFRHPVKAPELKQFYFGLKRLSRSLGEERSSDYWLRFLSPLQRYRFNLCSAPLPPGYLGESSSKVLAQLKLCIRSCNERYPAFSNPVGELLTQLGGLFSIAANPLLEEIRLVSSRYRKVGLVISSLRNFERTQTALAERGIRNVELVSATQLRKDISFDAIIYIGSTAWISAAQYIFSAPRAPVIHLIYYSWLKSSVDDEKVFSGPSVAGAVSKRSEETMTGIETEEVDADDLEAVPTVDIEGIYQRTVKTSEGRETNELAKAKLFVLSESFGVFLEADSESSVLVIDRSEESNRVVRSRPIRMVRPGMHIVLRTRDGGDYILPVADRALADSKDKLRASQGRWKQLLREKVKAMGFFKSSLAILDCGSSIADEINLRNWISPRSIKTQKKTEFAAIMKFIGLENEADVIWREMSIIAQAHRRAGHLIRKELFSKLDAANVAKLEQQGKLDVELPGIDVGTLTAYRVESISEKIIEVPYSRLAAPFDLEEVPWQE